MAILNASAESPDPDYRLIKTRQLLIERKFSAAAELVAKVVDGSDGAALPEVERLWLVARALAGETFDASEIEARVELDDGPQFVQWFNTRFRQSIIGAAQK